MRLSFQTLWDNHPANQTPAVITPCEDASGNGNFANQCAIRMSVCLINSGVNMSTFSGVFCWHGHGRNHVLRAQQLADYLHTRTDIVGNVEINRNPKASAYRGKKGVALYQNFWGTGNQGDHIDVWNGSRMGQGSADYFDSSQQVWFWELA